MAVVIVTPSLAVPGGVSNFVKVVIPQLSQESIVFEVGSRAGEAGPISGTKRLIRDYWRFHRLLGRGGIDVAHLNPSLVPKALIRDAVFLLIASFRRVPTIVFIHGWNKPVADALTGWLRWLFRLVFGHAKAFVVLSRDFKGQLAKMGVEAPIHIMTTCVEDSAFDFLAKRSPDAPRSGLLYLGRLDSGKGLLLCLGAYQLLRRSHPEVTLTIVGDGERRRAAEEFITANSLTGVSFMGHLDGVQKYKAYAGADIYVFTSRLDEGMPTTVLEAMAVGLPIVTRATGGLVDFFADGKMGRITQSEDPSDIARLLAELVGNPRHSTEIGTYNSHFARQHFTANAVASRLDELYGSLRQ